MKKSRRQFNGHALRDIRRNQRPNALGKKLTQAELAKKAGRSRNVVGRAERFHQCSKASAELFAKVLGLAVEEFYRDQPIQDSVSLTAQERQVIETMRISPEAAHDVYVFALGVRCCEERRTLSPKPPHLAPANGIGQDDGTGTGRVTEAPEKKASEIRQGPPPRA